mmetsp:Transcript_54467/g.159016  ORF Transcript_54467/g.159016 Transcript_54467/m.159016 type:complete len:291 (-) Transcript_54467:1263-2135(-)
MVPSSQEGLDELLDLGAALWREVEDQIHWLLGVLAQQQAHGLVVLGVALGRGAAVGLVRKDELRVVLGHALLGLGAVVLLDRRKRCQSALVLQCAYDGLRDGLHPQGGPEADLHYQLISELLLHEARVQSLGIRLVQLARGVQLLRQEVPLVGELRDHEGEVRVHPVPARRVREVAHARPAQGALVHGVAELPTRSQELLRRNDALIEGRDDLRERRNRAWIEVLPRQRVRLRVELRAVGAALDPLQGMEKEGEPLGRQCWEVRKVDGVLLLLPVRLQLVAVKGNACGLA